MYTIRFKVVSLFYTILVFCFRYNALMCYSINLYCRIEKVLLSIVIILLNIFMPFDNVYYCITETHR